jgi:hypothetical protein
MKDKVNGKLYRRLWWTKQAQNIKNLRLKLVKTIKNYIFID